MCRLFGQLTPRPADAARFLIESPIGLLQQAAPQYKQTHGWGMALGRKVVKEPKPAHDSALFRATAKRKAPVVLAHLREASDPKKMGPANTHPFTDGKWVFMHNGTVLSLPPAWKARNDSEYYFETWRKNYARTGDVYEAYLATVRSFKSYTSLNSLLTDGESLYALCHSRKSGAHDYAIFEKSQPWQVMSWHATDKAVLVASEPVDPSLGWRRLGPNQFLSAQKAGDRVKVEVREFKP